MKQLLMKALKSGMLLAATTCFLMLTGGCAKDKDLAMPELFTPVYAPLPPAFLTGPIGILLAGTQPFTAHIEESQADLRVSGEVFGKDGILVFAPDPDLATAKKAPEELFTFIWNVQAHSGYVLNDALQGYAPVTFGGNPATTTGQSSPTIQIANATNSATALSSAVVVEKSRSLNDFPVAFSVGSGPGATHVRLSRVRLTSPGADLFAPPKDFTPYDSPEVMAREVALRRRNLKF